jgi:hypothetical protein
MRPRGEGSDCPSGKVQWATKQDARDGGRYHNLSAYRCLVCGCWHAGNRRRADKRKTVTGR